MTKHLRLFCVLGLLCFYSVMAQRVDFRPPKNDASTLTLNGDIQVIGNAITGLSGLQPEGGVPGINTTINYNPNDSYDGQAYNDLLTQDYIDIDDNDDTFSSSSADLSLGSPCSKIAYAGLYWTATYYTQKNADNSPQLEGLPVVDNRPDFRAVKLKLPGSSDYIDINAEAGTEGTIYDGWRNTPTNPANQASQDIPYVCYADVTSILQSQENLNGTFTVANVRSTTGETSRGSGISSGWTLVVIYEDNTLSRKYFSTRHGFLEIIGNENREFEYSGFRTLPAPNPIRARFAVAALEGDYVIEGDGLSIVGGYPFELSALPVNQATNFFNSSISVDGEYNLARNPASKNTLGFDLDIFDVPNPNNNVIGNNQEQVDFTATTSGDRYRIFFNAFAVEVVKPELNVATKILDATSNDVTGVSAPIGSEIFYELKIQNIGNEGLVNTKIESTIPDRFILDPDSYQIPENTTVFYDENTRSIEFTIPDDLVETDDIALTFRFGGQIVNDCTFFGEDCGFALENQTYASYQGIISGTVVDNDTGSNVDDCGNPIGEIITIQVDVSSCQNLEKTAFLCGENLEIVAGDGFDTYQWTDVSTGMVIGTEKNITISSEGQYRVDKTGASGCDTYYESWTVTNLSITNPIIQVANDRDVNGNIRECPITGNDFPEIFLCGADDEIYLYSGFANAKSIVWQRLDPTACPMVVRNENCPTVDPACEPNWTDIATTRDISISEAGEYRIVVDFEGGCSENFYFNVFKNVYEPVIYVEDIICGNTATVEVQNAVDNFEYQLEFPDGTTTDYQESPVFERLTRDGLYVLRARENSGLVTACISESSLTINIYDPRITYIVDEITCAEDQANLNVQVSDSKGNNVYNLSSNTNSFMASSGSITASEYTFTNLLPDNYQLEVYTNDGVCVDVMNVSISELASLSISTITESAGCYSDGVITVEAIGGAGDYEYELRDRFDNVEVAFQENNVFTNLYSDEYTAVVRDSNGCTITETIFLEGRDLEVILDESNTVVCYGENTASIDAEVSNTDYTTQYTVSGTDNEGNTVYLGPQSSSLFENLKGGSYDYEITTGVNCVERRVFSVFEIPEIIITLEANNESICNGDTNGEIKVKVNIGLNSGIETYILSLGNEVIASVSDDIDGVTNEHIFTNLSAGLYTIQVVKYNGCNSSQQITLNENEPITFNIDTQPVTPNTNGLISIQATGGLPDYQYELRDLDSNVIVPFQDIDFFSITEEGTYYVVIKDTLGCEVIEEIYIPFEVEHPITDYAGELLFCTLTGQSYPVVNIEDEMGVFLEVDFQNALVVWQKLDETNCNRPLDTDCPTTDDSCTSAWFNVGEGDNITVLEPGEYRIVVTFNGRSARTSEVYYFRVTEDQVLSIDKPESVEFTMLPNPTKGEVAVNKEVSQIQLYDLKGQKVFTTTATNFDISKLPAGMYFAEIMSREGIKKVLKVMKE